MVYTCILLKFFLSTNQTSFLFQDITHKSQNSYSQDEVKAIFMQVGFRIISIESSVKKYTFPDFSSLLSKHIIFLF